MTSARIGQLGRTACGALVAAAALCVTLSASSQTAQPPASITVDAGAVNSTVPKYLYGQFIEHEHNTIDDGLLAQLLHDRKFEEGDRDGNGVSAGWVPEERITDHYYELQNGKGVHDRYFIDHTTFYGGGASQGIELTGGDANHASIYQIKLQFAKGKKYSFYVYLRKQGTGSGFVEVDSLGGPVVLHKEFTIADGDWAKYQAEFTAPEDTKEGRVRIGFAGEGTFWMDSSSLMPADNIDGMRGDVIEALKAIHVSILRYPGGCYADFYDWRKGIGPRDKRPDTWSTAWQEWNSNDFGTDEYLELAAILGYVGHVTINFGSGTPKMAADWVEYANGQANTPMGALRALNGHADPYKITLWAMGNEAPNFCSEQYTGGTKLVDYTRRYAEFSDAMRSVDPSIQIMASSVGNPAWVKDVATKIDPPQVATSIYTGKGGATRMIGGFDQKVFYESVIGETAQQTASLEKNIESGGHKPGFVAITEFNSWWRPETEDPDYRLVNGLYFANSFNSFLRHAKNMFLTENCSLINVQGILEVNPVSVKLTPPYMAYLLYTNHTGSDVVDSETNSPPLDFNPKLPMLDVVATRSADGKTLYLAVVNRSRTNDANSRIHLKGWKIDGPTADAYVLNGKTWDAANPFGETDQVNVAHEQVPLKQGSGSSFSHKFPAHSATILEIPGRLLQ